MDTVNEKLKARQRELDAEATRVSPEVAERNAEAELYMQDYRRRLADKKAAEQAQRDAAFEASIAPVKRREMLQWLIDHPGQGESDFEQVWPHVRELLKIGDRDELIQREIEAQRLRY
jgi:hypothetical protein